MRTSSISYVIQEDIRAIEEYPGEFIRVSVGSKNSKGEWEVPQQFLTYVIKDSDYTELMSANPEWAQGKPSGTYRNEDLWVFIDKQRSLK